MVRYTGIRIVPYKLGGIEIENAGKHNLPGREAENADPSRAHLNREIADIRNGLDFTTYVQEKLSEYQFKGSQNRKIRKDAIGSLELIVRANGVIIDDEKQKPKDFDINKWAKDTLEWADKQFNPENHLIQYIDRRRKQRTERIQNIYSAVLHMDESTPHIHFMILPIDRNGHLNSKEYRAPGQILDLHDSYYKDVGKEYGLERGFKNSPAKAINIQKYHTYINEVMANEAPIHIPGETMEMYDSRVTEELQKCHAHMRNQELSHEREKNQLIAKKDTIIKEQYRLAAEVNKELTGESKKDFDMQRIHSIGRHAREDELLRSALRSYPDREYADEMRLRIRNLIEWEIERARQQDLEKSYEEELNKY